MENLAPDIYRQRLIIEAKPSIVVDKEKIDSYLTKLSTLLGMTLVMGPLTRDNPKYGFSSYIYWEESGTHFYHWKKPFPFLSVDIYSCKEFDVDLAVDFTKEFFETIEIVFKKV